MGEVYEAEHLRVGKKVAVKFMHGDAVGDRRALERFRREVRALSSITNEHVVSVLDCGELDDETPYIVMERLEGQDLRHVLAKESPLSVYRALRLALDACAGLAAVHAAGLVHRDLKPANLFVTRSKTRGEMCKILDFGVAKGQTSEVTSQGALLGTIRYMAPEQLSNSASVAATADVYALGTILYECLTGRPAHDADSPEAVMFDILNRDPPDVTELRPELPQELSDIISCAISRRPSDRFQSILEFVAALRPLLPASDSDETAHDLSQAAPPPSRIRRSFGVRRLKVAVTSALVVGIAIGFALSKLGERDAATAESRPSAPAAEARGIEARATPSEAPAPVRASEPEKMVLLQPTDDVRASDAIPKAVAPPRRALPPASPAVPARSAPPPPAAGAFARPVRPPSTAAFPAEKGVSAPAPVASAVKHPSAPAAVVLDVKNPYEE